MLDDRIVKVGIEINGELRVYSDLWVSASGTKFANPTQNECEIKVANLSRDVRDYLMTEVSPFNKNKTPKRIIIEAGRKSLGTFRLFEGDITEVNPTQAPDIILTMKAKTGQFRKGQPIAINKESDVNLSVIAQDVARALELTLQFEATDKRIANFSYTGSKLKMIDKLADAGRVNAYIDDTHLIVKDWNVPLRQVVHVLSMDSGLIGIPEITEQGVKVRYLLDPQSKLGGELVLESTLNPAASGNYTIYKLGFEVASRDTPFYHIAECKRKGDK